MISSKVNMETFLEEHAAYKPAKIHFIRQGYITFSSLLQGICNGFIFGMSSILLPQLEESQEIPLTKSEQSWIASIPPLMMIPTVLLTGPILDKFGRKKALIYVFSLTALCWIVTYSSNSFATLMVGRGLGGMFVGQAYPMVMTYIGEITDPSIRAACLAAVPLGAASGVLIVQLLGIYFHWKTVCLVVLVLPLYNLCVAIFYIKESYIWCINKGWEDRANESFLWYRGQTPKLKTEFLAALSNNGASNLSLKEKIRYCLSKKFLYPFGLTCLLYLTSEFSGDIAIIFYTSTIIKILSNDESIQYYATLVLNILRVVTTGLSCILLKKLSVRKVWIGTGYCLSMSLLNIALFLYLSLTYPKNNIFPLVCIVSIVVNVIFFALGAGPLPTVICGELYPAPVRGIGGTVSAFICFSSIFCVVSIMPYLFDYVPSPVIFLIFGLCTFTGVTVSCFVLPNTKNRTLKELETFYKK